VLGETVERPSSLPRTGAAVGGLTLLGLGLVGSGRIAVLARRLLRIG
jgi:LPXTG-motif cell wall-anchored protein